MEEQRRANQERIDKMGEQRRTDLQTAEERSRRDMQKMLLELRTGRTSTSTRPSTEHFPSLKINFKEFSGEPEDWNTWSRVHQAQLSALECAETLSAKGNDDIEIGSGDFDSSIVDPERLRTAQSGVCIADYHVQGRSV